AGRGGGREPGVGAPAGAVGGRRYGDLVEVGRVRGRVREHDGVRAGGQAQVHRLGTGRAEAAGRAERDGLRGTAVDAHGRLPAGGGAVAVGDHHRVGTGAG